MGLANTLGQSLVRVETDAGVVGYGEAGADGPTVRAQLAHLEDDLLGEDPVEVERHFEVMRGRQHTYRPHAATVSGVDIALWDLAGKLLDRPVSSLINGRFREEVPFYMNGGPEDMLDPDSCAAWVEEVTDAPTGPHPVKIGFGYVIDSDPPDGMGGVGQRLPTLERSAVRPVRRAARNLRDAMGGEMDFVAHFHNEWDLPSATALCEALEPGDPLWVEDPLPVEYGQNWKTLHENSPVPVLTGEKLEFAGGFEPFLRSGAVDAVQPDLAFAGGITGARRIADLAARNYVPVTAHDVGSLVLNAATVHFGASVRNFWTTETRLPQVPLFDEMGASDGLDARNGTFTVPDGPGLGVEVDEDVIRENRADGEPYWG
jgi:galactonate dehydratase